jgi:hypothetical protein
MKRQRYTLTPGQEKWLNDIDQRCGPSPGENLIA